MAAAHRMTLVLSIGTAILSSSALAGPGGNGNGNGKPDGSGGGSSLEIQGTDGPDDFCFGTNTGGVTGTENDDSIYGAGGDDDLCGFGGNDQLWGDGGDDYIDGGPGNDAIRPGDGNDTIDAGDGDDTILSSSGNDVIDGGPGNDWMPYNSNDQQLIVDFTAVPGTITNLITGEVDTVTSVESIKGTPNDDVFYGGDADESFGGGRGDDYLDGGPGDDFLGADRGNDTIIGGPGNDILRGAEHSDTFIFRAVDYVGLGERDVIEDFNTRADCISIVPPLAIVPGGIVHMQIANAGKNSLDTVITLNAGGTIEVWDVTLDESDLGCASP